MGKTRNTGKLATQIQFDNSNNLVIGNSTSSSFNTSGSVNATGGITGSIYGIGDPTSFSASISSNLVSIQSVTASNIARLSNLETKSSSVDISVSSINTFTSSNANTSLNLLTSSLATTGSNTFKGTQIVSASMYVQGDFVVYGSSSIQYISASSVSIGTNIVNLNTATPAVRYAGLSVQDSGSAQGVTGSMLWDSVCNRWIYSNPSGVGYSGGVIMSGPRAATFGTETTLTCNYIAKSGGGDHLYDSCIIDDGTTVCINANLKGSGTACFAGNVCAPVAVFTGCVGIGLGAAAQTALEVNGGNTYFPSKIITISGAENTRYNGFMGLNLIGGSQIGMSLGTRSNNIDYTNTLNLYQGNVGIGTNTTTPTEKLEINVGAGSRSGMAITGEYPYIILNNSGSTSPNARSFALSLTSLEAGDFAIKMANCKNGNPVTDGFDPFRISRGGDITITCSLTIAGCGLIMSGTGALTLPNGTTAQRPGTPSAGMIRYNNISSTTEYYNGCSWYSFSDNYVHDVDVLVVAGGGGGGINNSGAGGGGGVLYFTGHKIKPGIPITVIVGGGGAVASDQGGSSCIFNNLVEGGQRASQTIYHKSGNNGLITLCSNSYCYTSALLYCNVQGGCATGNAGGGGGGAGAPGANMCGNSDVSWPAKAGGCGVQVGRILDGINNYYWAGGGGGEGYGDYGGAGGCGGGGGGGAFSAYGTQFYPGCGGLGGLNPGCPGTVTNSPLNGGAGGANTGGGGGGGSHTGAGQTSATGGPGGSGIIIIRYPQHYNAPTITGTTPCICINCGYRSYIFLSSGTITF